MIAEMEIAASLPTLTTARLILRPRVLADLPACLAMDRDPEVVRHVPDIARFLARTPPDAAGHEAFVRRRMTTRFPDGLGYWSVVLREAPDRFLGWVLLIPVDAVGPEVEIGWRLTRESRSHGFATEAALPVLQHGFDTVGLSRIVADILTDNAASCRVAEKLSLRHVADVTHAGLRYRSYALTREEYGRGVGD
jgi:RimJ/RimL family protein N-acetyltransferase